MPTSTQTAAPPLSDASDDSLSRATMDSRTASSDGAGDRLSVGGWVGVAIGVVILATGLMAIALRQQRSKRAP